VIFCTNFVWHIFNFKKNWVIYYKCSNVFL
jgi:hypothetical protein